MSNGLISRDNSFLVIIDIQEKLAPAIAGVDKVVAAAEALLAAANILGVPVMFTEHCASRIGHIDEAVAAAGAASFSDEELRAIDALDHKG